MVEFIIKGIIYFLLLLVSLYDIKYKEIPNRFMGSLTILVLFQGIINKDIERVVINGALYLLPFSLIYGYMSDFLKKECLGYADVKLAFVIGALSKDVDILTSLIYLELTFILSIIFIFIFYLKNKKLLKEIPLIPFMILAFFIMEIKKI